MLGKMVKSEVVGSLLGPAIFFSDFSCVSLGSPQRGTLRYFPDEILDGLGPADLTMNNCSLENAL